MKRTAVFLLLFSVILYGCVQKSDAPQDTLNVFFTHMQNGEYEQADKYIFNPSEERLSDELDTFDQSSEFIRILRSFTFTLDETKEPESDKAEIWVTATYPNMVPAFSTAMTELSTLLFTDPAVQSLSDEGMAQKVNELLSKHAKSFETETERKETQFSVTLHKKEGKWLIDIDNKDLVLMLTGNLFSNESP